MIKKPLTQKFISDVYIHHKNHYTNDIKLWLSNCATDLNTSWEMINRAYETFDVFESLNQKINSLGSTIEALNKENESLKNEIKRLNNLMHTEP